MDRYSFDVIPSSMPVSPGAFVYPGAFRTTAFAVRAISGRTTPMATIGWPARAGSEPGLTSAASPKRWSRLATEIQKALVCEFV
ncbi:MAG TPA: hypothetical protein VIK11_13345, partial [Tepidiformaceae bacterium]